MAVDARRLFVGNIPDDLDEGEIRSVFEEYGKVNFVGLQKGQRYCFIAYDLEEDAEAAIETLNETYKFNEDDATPIRVKIANAKGSGKDGGKGGDRDRGGRDDPRAGRDRGSGRGCSGSGGRGPPNRSRDLPPPPRFDSKSKGRGSSQPTPKLFIGNLPDDVDKAGLEYVFGTYGRIEEIHIMLSKGAGKKSSAFVRYVTIDEAEDCLEAMRAGYEFRPGDGNLNVRFADEASRDRDGGKYGDYAPRAGGKNGHPPPAAYGKAGHGPSAGYGKAGYPPDYGYGAPPPAYGWGFPSEYGWDPSGWEPPVAGGGKGFGKSGGKGFGKDAKPSSRGAGKPSSRGGKSGREGVKLYVGGMPPDISEEAVKYVFENYGRLEDLHIMRGRGRGDRSCAFVVYADAEDAEACVAAMEVGYEIQPGDGYIDVKFAQEKSHDRRPRDTRGRQGPY